jgi:hypothetical protein
MATGEPGFATSRRDSSPHEGGANPSWPVAGSTRTPGRGTCWPRVLLGFVVGALLGAAVTVGALVYAGPQPTPLPVSTHAGTVTLTVDDTFLTAAMREGLNQSPLGASIHGVTAHCVPGGRILVAGESSLDPLNIHAPLTMTLEPTISQGRLSVHVLTATIGGLVLPGTLDAQIESALNDQMRSLGAFTLTGSLRYVVSSVTTTDGQMTLTLRPA